MKEEIKKKEIIYYTENDVVDIAKVMYRECYGVKSKTEQACVAWTILNRVDTYGDSIHNIVRAPNQYAFSENTVVNEDMINLARDVLSRWNSEKNGVLDVGRVLPVEYIYFYGDGVHNYFRNGFKQPRVQWNYALASPYEN